MPSDPALMAQRYDFTTRALHWGVAALVLFQWFGAHAIDYFSPGPGRVAARSVHIVVGTALVAVMGVRIWWRARHGVRFAPHPRRALAAAARITHLSLYALAAGVLGLGLLNTWVRGDSIFGLFHVAALGHCPPLDRHALANQVVAWHRLAANLILALAGFHAAAALAHEVWLRDTVLKRMVLISDRPS